MKQQIRKIWNKLVALVCKVPYDKLLHFIAGLIIAAFFALVAPSWKWGAIVSALVAGVAKEVFDYCTTKQVDYKDALATLIGGAVIQLFVLL